MRELDFDIDVECWHCITCSQGSCKEWSKCVVYQEEVAVPRIEKEMLMEEHGK